MRVLLLADVWDYPQAQLLNCEFFTQARLLHPHASVMWYEEEFRSLGFNRSNARPMIFRRDTHPFNNGVNDTDYLVVYQHRPYCSTGVRQDWKWPI